MLQAIVSDKSVILDDIKNYYLNNSIPLHVPVFSIRGSSQNLHVHVCLSQKCQMG